MVLSNKKLKQKLREELSRSIISSESKPSPSTPSAKPQSLTQLFEAAAHKPRLTKREKRRGNATLKPAPADETKVGDSSSEVVVESKKKKRKRDESGGEAGVKGSADVKKEESGEKEEKTTKKKEKKTKKRKRDESGGEAGVKGSADVKKEESGGREEKTTKKKKKNKKKWKKKIQKKKEKEKEKGEPAEEPEVVSGERVDQSSAQKDNVTESQGNEVVLDKVYVGGIPYYSMEDDIRSFFDHCGTITEVDCMKFPETFKFRGIAILSFKTEEAAKRALALDGADMGGFFLKIQRYNKTTIRPTKTPNFSPPVIQGYNRIYAGNLSWEITEEDLKSFFSDCSISSVRFGEDKETGEFKGYAHVDFADGASVEKALALDQRVVCGRPVRITRAVPLRKPQAPQPASKGTMGNDGSASVVDPPAVAPESVSVAVVDNSGLSTGKLRRRTCYECGEKGHISSLCPKKLAAEQPKDSNAG